MAKKSVTKDEKRHLQRVVDLGCIICGGPACAHHIRHGQGMSQRASNYEAIPLCWGHHQGPEGIHHLGTRIWESRYGTERELLAQVHRELGYVP